MEQLLERILAGVYVLIGLWLVTIAPLIYIILSQLDKRGQSVMPSVNTFQKAGRALGKIVKRRFAFRVTKQKLAHAKETVIPDVPVEFERWMARELLRELETKMCDEISLSVSTWKGRFPGTAEQFTALMKRWETERIVCKLDGRGKRGFVQPYRSIQAKLRGKVK
jgi:hypothetical protein